MVESDLQDPLTIEFTTKTQALILAVPAILQPLLAGYAQSIWASELTDDVEERLDLADEQLELIRGIQRIYKDDGTYFNPASKALCRIEVLAEKIFHPNAYRKFIRNLTEPR